MKNVAGDFDKAEVQKILDIYKTDRTSGIDLMLKKIDKYITQIMYSQKYYEFSRNPSLNSDIRQQIYLEIMMAMDTYDIEKGSPVTFFKPCIQAGIRKIVDDHNGFTSYYSSVSRRIRQIQAERAKRDLSTTVDDCILEMPDVSPTTIKETFRQMFAIENSFSLDGTLEEDMDCYIPYHITPESVYFEKTDNKILYETIDSALTELEKNVVILTYRLYKSDYDFLTDILKHSSRYSDIEIIKANGYTGAKFFTAIEFSPIEALQYIGISKEDAEKFYGILVNGGTEEETDFVVALQEKIQEKKNQELFNQVDEAGLICFMQKLGYSENKINDRLQYIHKKASTLKKPEQLDTEALLKGKGFDKKDIDNIYVGKKISQAKMATILGISAQDVKNATSNAEHKLKKALAVLFPERSVQNNMYKDMLDEEVIPTISEAERYAEAFMEQFAEMD